MLYRVQYNPFQNLNFYSHIYILTEAFQLILARVFGVQQ